MRKKKKEKKADEQFWATFHYMNVPKHLIAIPEHVEKVRFRLYDNVEDDHLARMVKRIKSIGQLDLDETNITNNGIMELVQLDFIKEIRLKGCRAITNEAMFYLCSIKGIELLHLIGTAITTAGFNDISKLKSLKTLLISADKNDSELANIFAKLPTNCELIVDYKTYPFD